MGTTAPRIPAKTKLVPSDGIIIQIYRGGIDSKKGKAEDQAQRFCDEIVKLGLKDVCWHGFPQEMQRNWDRLAKYATDRGLTPIASWGLDGKKDNDGTRLTAAEKGACLGDVLSRENCAAGLLDAEGQWDSDLGPDDDMDEKGALELGSALLAKAPNALIGDQPWYAIEAHGDKRRTVQPIEQGGSFAGFPVDEFGTFTKWGRFRQAYIYLDQGSDIEDVFPRMDREWNNIAEGLRAVNAEQPLRCTIQGYRWKLHKQVFILLERCIIPGNPIVVWSHPFPDETTLLAIRIVRFLKERGFVKPGLTARQVVTEFQRALMCAGHSLPGGADGWFGYSTNAVAGGL